MYKRIEKALSLRISMLEFLRRVKSMDNSISGLEFKHGHYVEDDTANMFPLWTEWEDLVQDYTNSMINCENAEKLSTIIEGTHEKVALLFKRTILEALTELIVCDIYVDKLVISTSGIDISSSEDPNFHSYYTDRYVFPPKLKETLDNLELIDETLVNAVIDDLEVDREKHFWYLEFKKPAIIINLAQE